MKKVLKSMVACLPTPAVYAMHRAYHELTGTRQRRADVAFLRAWPDPLRVRTGPFAGMVLLREAYATSLVACVLGIYEKELHAAVEQLCAWQADVIADIGAAEGYYAVGMALRNPQAQVLAFEMFKPSNHILGKTAQANGVAGRVRRPGTCSVAKLRAGLASAQKPAVICDCEGFEQVLLDPEAVPALRRAAILVELHDHLAPGVAACVRERFRLSHELTVIEAVERTRADLPEGTSMTDEDFSRLVPEFREVRQQFFMMAPRATQ